MYDDKDVESRAVDGLGSSALANFHQASFTPHRRLGYTIDIRVGSCIMSNEFSFVRDYYPYQELMGEIVTNKRKLFVCAAFWGQFFMCFFYEIFLKEGP